MNGPNTELIGRMAEALGELRERLVFVGGCATALLITDPAATPVRATHTARPGLRRPRVSTVPGHRSPITGHAFDAVACRRKP